MFLTKSLRSVTYRAILVDVEAGLIARILNSRGCKDHPQSDGVNLVIRTRAARWNQDRDLRAGNHVSALRAAQVLHGFSEEIACLDVRDHHTVGVTCHRMLDALRLRRRLQKRAIEGKRAEDLYVTELAGFAHLGEIPEIGRAHV